MTENPRTPKITFGDHLRHVLAAANAINAGGAVVTMTADAVAEAARDQVLAVYQTLGFDPSVDAHGHHDGWYLGASDD